VTPVPLPLSPLLASDRPLVLLPVRLETRFVPAPDGGLVVKIRVYPDTIHSDTHEPGVTLSEAEWGRHYWRTVWHAGNDTERRKAAWRQMAERYEPQRIVDCVARAASQSARSACQSSSSRPTAVT
jgi:hypothetical protein